MRSATVGAMVEVVARGHPALRTSHAKTLELIRAGEVTERASCVIGVGAAYDLDAAAALCGPVRVELRAGDLEPVVVRARVAPQPSVGDGLVLRRSDCPGGRTFAHSATAGASELPRDLRAAVADPATTIVATVTPEDGVGAVVVTPGPSLPASPDPSELLAILREPGRATLAVPVLDPGAVAAATLVRVAVDAGAEIAVVAGTAAHPLRALAASGIAGEQATFVAAPSGRREAERLAGMIAGSPVTTVAGPAPGEDLLRVAEALPADRTASLLLDPGGDCERFVHDTAERCAERLATARSEAILVAAPGRAGLSAELESLVRTLDVPPSDLAKALAAALGVKRNEAYDHVRRLRDET